MNIIKTVDQYNIRHVYFNEPIQNTVIDNSKFIKIIYSNEEITLNGIYIILPITISSTESFFKKIKYSFDFSTNKQILEKIFNIEKNILNKYDLKKEKKYLINDTLRSGYIKIFFNENEKKKSDQFILKISGLWENETEYGLTFKFLSIC